MHIHECSRQYYSQKPAGRNSPNVHQLMNEATKMETFSRKEELTQATTSRNLKTWCWQRPDIKGHIFYLQEVSSVVNPQRGQTIGHQGLVRGKQEGTAYWVYSFLPNSLEVKVSKHCECIFNATDLYTLQWSTVLCIFYDYLKKRIDDWNPKEILRYKRIIANFENYNKGMVLTQYKEILSEMLKY